MTAYLSRRLIDVIVTVVGVSTIVFFVLRLSGDPIALLVPQDATPAQVAQLRHEYGLSDPLAVQYARFLWNASHLDLGQSLQFHRPAIQLILETLPATIQLAFAALFVAVAVAVPAGTIAAMHRNGVVDKLLTTATLLGQSMPYFWLGILLILAFAVNLRVLPTSGYGGLAYFIMPTLTLSAGTMAKTSRLVRSGMLRVLREDYMRTARAKGLAQRVALTRHGLKNAAIPIITSLGVDFGVLLGGAVVTETIFGWPGVGRLIVQSISVRDYPVVQAGVLYLSLVFVIISGLVDVAYGYLDPRIRVQ